MSILKIISPDDPRLALYLHMRDRNIRRETPFFLAEGEHVVRRAVAAGIELDSVLVTEKKAARVAAFVPERVPILACPEALMREAAGFDLHQGIVAAGRPRQSVTLREAADVNPSAGSAAAQRTLVVCPEIGNVDNLGLLIRVAAALGVDAMVLGERCADPWYRRAVRVSMGAVFTLPIAQSTDIYADLQRLRDAHGYATVATVIDADAPPLHAVRRDDLPDRLAVLLGSEGYGLPAEIVTASDLRVRIPMHHEVDSLNVAVAAGIILHHLGPTGSGAAE